VKRRRWYDQESTLTRSLEQVKRMPQPEIQSFCGKILRHLSEQMRRQIQASNQNGVTSIGLQGLEGLYHFKKQERRWYDPMAELQQAVGSLYRLPSEGLVALGFSLGDTIGLVSIYAQVCQELKEDPKPREMVLLMQKILMEGQDEAAAFVKSLVGNDLFAVLYQSTR